VPFERKQMKFSERFAILMKEYEEAYDLTTLNSANDRINLEMLVNNAILVNQLQEEISILAENDAGANITEIKKLSDAVRDLTTQMQAIERQLGIDRKSRKRDNSSTTGEYILLLKETAKNFIEKRLVKVYCKKCKIMVGRIAPVHEHTQYSAVFECSQCRKLASVTRESKDVFFDLHRDDREWRKKYPVEIKQPKERKIQLRDNDQEDLAEAELIIEEDDND
jgi:hypothetical protein